MKKAYKHIKKFVIFCLICLSLLIAPFSVYAELDETSFTLDDIFTRANISYDNSDSTFRNYVTINFKGHYYGQATFYYSYKLGSSSNTTTGYRQLSFNGDSVTFMISTSGQSINQTSFYITDITNPVNVVKVDNYTEQFPWESFSIQSFNLSNNPVVGIDYRYGYTFNIFQLYGYLSNYFTEYPAMHQFYGYANSVYTWIFWIDKNIYDTTTLANFIGLGNNLALRSVQVLDRFHYEGHTTSLLKVTLVGNNNAGNTLRWQGQDDALYMPVYFNFEAFRYISTDFALRFGLTNDLLDSLKAIQPNVDTNESAADLEDSQSDFSQSASDLFDYENSFNESMNDSLENINVQFNVGNQLGSKFLASASWVRTQFDSLTNNTPFGTVLSFSLILGIALLIIGKAVR